MDYSSKRYKSQIWKIDSQELSIILKNNKNIKETLKSLNIDEKISSLRWALMKRIKIENLDVSHMNLEFNFRKGKVFSKYNKKYKTQSIKIHKIDFDGLYICCVCNKKYSKNGIGTHYFLNHGEGVNHKSFNPNVKTVAWNKGLTKELSSSVKKAADTFKKRIQNGEIVMKPPMMTEDVKKKISLGMKKAHEEDRAWNIGKSRWKNKPSYPEIFFAKVIENEFKNKNYKKEYSVSRYSLDFAWVDKKLCIEIDGEQHERFEEYKKRDIKKDELLISLGWKILRIKWKEKHSDPKKWIKIAYEFIHNN